MYEPLKEPSTQAADSLHRRRQYTSAGYHCRPTGSKAQQEHVTDNGPETAWGRCTCVMSALSSILSTDRHSCALADDSVSAFPFALSHRNNAQKHHVSMKARACRLSLLRRARVSGCGALAYLGGGRRSQFVPACAECTSRAVLPSKFMTLSAQARRRVRSCVGPDRAGRAAA